MSISNTFNVTSEVAELSIIELLELCGSPKAVKEALKELTAATRKSVDAKNAIATEQAVLEAAQDDIDTGLEALEKKRADIDADRADLIAQNETNLADIKQRMDVCDNREVVLNQVETDLEQRSKDTKSLSKAALKESNALLDEARKTLADANETMASAKVLMGEAVEARAEVAAKAKRIREAIG